MDSAQKCEPESRSYPVSCPNCANSTPQDADIVKVDIPAVASAGSDADAEEEKEDTEKPDEEKDLGNIS